MLWFLVICLVEWFKFSKIKKKGLWRSGVSTDPGFPKRIPNSGATDTIWELLLSPECRRERQHLPGHSAREMVGDVRRAVDSVVHSELAQWSESGECAESPGGWLVEEPGPVQKVSAGEVWEGGEGQAAAVEMVVANGARYPYFYIWS